MIAPSRSTLFALLSFDSQYDIAFKNFTVYSVQNRALHSFIELMSDRHQFNEAMKWSVLNRM